MGTLDSKIALITGASRGIGVAIAQRFAAEGAHVVLVARTLDAHDRLPGSLRESVTLIQRYGGSAEALECDLSDTHARATLIERCRQTFGAPDILVNNAAAAFYLPLANVSAKRYHIAFELNLHAPFELSQAFVPEMIRKGHGWILNISSATAELPQQPYDRWAQLGGATLYGASKAALNRMSVGMAAELFGHNIVVNALAPVSAVITPGVVALGIDQGDPNFRVEPVEAMAEAALALCSAGVDLYTGEVAYSLEFLQRIGRTVRGLDGSGEVRINC